MLLVKTFKNHSTGESELIRIGLGKTAQSPWKKNKEEKHSSLSEQGWPIYGLERKNMVFSILSCRSVIDLFVWFFFCFCVRKGGTGTYETFQGPYCHERRRDKSVYSFGYLPWWRRSSVERHYARFEVFFPSLYLNLRVIWNIVWFESRVRQKFKKSTFILQTNKNFEET